MEIKIVKLLVTSYLLLVVVPLLLVAMPLLLIASLLLVAMPFVTGVARMLLVKQVFSNSQNCHHLYFSESPI